MFKTLKSFSKIIVCSLLLICCLSIQLDAQRRDNNRNRNENTEDYFDESGVGSFRFWYGGGIGLNFGSGFNVFVGQNTSQFNFSISPMVGYKLTPEFSVGPRVELIYTHLRVGGGTNNVRKFNFLDYGVGAFARYKLFQQFFLHTEYQVESIQQPDGPRFSQNNFFLGGGYTSGGQIGYEISILWDLIEDENTINLPIDYRIAFTYNF
ncbi:MAG: hypothetical protein AAGJ18_00725 [Bacteroidota bacterium]